MHTVSKMSQVTIDAASRERGDENVRGCASIGLTFLLLSPVVYGIFGGQTVLRVNTPEVATLCLRIWHKG
jgi:hypothetical protein